MQEKEILNIQASGKSGLRRLKSCGHCEDMVAPRASLSCVPLFKKWEGETGRGLKYTHHDELGVTFGMVEALSCTPGTNISLNVNYTGKIFFLMWPLVTGASAHTCPERQSLLKWCTLDQKKKKKSERLPSLWGA